jgi:hypothetical protein
MKNQHHSAYYYQDNLYYFKIIDDEINLWSEFGINGINESYTRTYDIPELSCSKIKEIMMDVLLYKKFNIVDYLTSKRLY